MWEHIIMYFRNKLRVLTGMLVLTLSLFNGQALPVEAAVFKDLEGHWAAKHVESLSAQDIISTDASGLFYPDKQVTRAELVSMLVRALAHEEEKANSADVEGLGQVSFLRTSASLPVINKPLDVGSAVIINPRIFTAQMQLLKDQGYHTITSQDLYDYLYKNLALPEKPVMITFDDGYESNYTLAYPYGAYNAATERIAQELGYLMTLSTRAGFVKSGETGYMLKRININGDDDLLTFQSKLIVNAN